MDDKEFIAERIRALEEAIDFYSNDRRDERELWVVRTFLENLHIEFTEDELVWMEDDPPDVVFRDCRFEVKELMDEDRRRTDEYKKQLEIARKATRSEELFHTYRPRDSSVQEIYDECLNRIMTLRDKYADSVKRSCDLLIYFNRTHIMEIFEEPLLDVSLMKQEGWRSVSFVKGQRSCCFCANESAPLLLKAQQAGIHYLHGE